MCRFRRTSKHLTWVAVNFLYNKRLNCLHQHHILLLPIAGLVVAGFPRFFIQLPSSILTHLAPFPLRHATVQMAYPDLAMPAVVCCQARAGHGRPTESGRSVALSTCDVERITCHAEADPLMPDMSLKSENGLLNVPCSRRAWELFSTCPDASPE